jgi:single-stranded DNA-specific DHH superfamily exonuclease
MFLCQPLLEVLAGRGIEDIDAFLKVPSWNDLPHPFSIPVMEQATARVLSAIRNRDRIAIFGDYDCDGILGSHILRSVLSALGATASTFLPHRDEATALARPQFIVFRAAEPTCLSRLIMALTRGRQCSWRNDWESTSS